ncbi:hypothetical protein CONPUDRAFT_93817 [Coniophora puteana RWD-64-598 SS2]|uniref:Uncharacterized protein n=1 Tax=Coniophora puteana (strain RWD-64-598) TaxID=741705 RepID=R7SEN8_CONPW|nr:uncharacterized protein CONPUDRAFT_93817 [Coniophora puteana RWD-64-598 SS2]EIW74646.1 hypothetical protein CONPUDRAFT_93817 [Coniophora puteana RWD-64-598 SS2]
MSQDPFKDILSWATRTAQPALKTAADDVNKAAQGAAQQAAGFVSKAHADISSSVKISDAWKVLDEVKRAAGGGNAAVVVQSLAVQAEKGVGDVAKLLANEAHTFYRNNPHLVATLLQAGDDVGKFANMAAEEIHRFYLNHPNLVSAIPIGIGIALAAPPASVILLGVLGWQQQGVIGGSIATKLQSSIYGPYTCGVFSLLQHTGALAAVDVAALVGGVALIGVGVAMNIQHDKRNYDAQSKGRVGVGLVDIAAGPSAAAMRIAAQIRGSRILSALQSAPAMEMVGAGGGKV